MEAYKKINIIVIIICFVLVSFLSVGYSYLQQYLDITTNVTLRANKDIRITSISIPNTVNGAYELYNSKYTEKTITNNIVLPNIDSQVSYTVTIKNNSSIAMEIEDIMENVFDNDSTTYDLDNMSVGTVLTSGETKTFTITYKYKSHVTTLPLITTLGVVLEFKYKEYSETSYEYALGGLLLHLKGTNAPVNGKWIDSYNSTNQMTLNNVNYNDDYNYYDFANGYATLDAPIIPRTGDFTLEVYLRTPEVRTATDDKAIVSQLSDTAASDPGRFKMGDKSLGLSVFYSQTIAKGTNPTYMFTSSANSKTKYLLQYVREGEYSKLYLNGLLTNDGYSYSSANYISQGPFKIAKFNNSKLQHFDGQVYAVRVYNRALSSLELTNNYEADINNYDPNSTYVNLFEYATNYEIVTSGDGLYNTDTGTYIYKGLNVNNYLRFEGNSDLYRIVSLNSDGTAKLFNSSITANVSFDASGNRTNYEGAYCDKVETLVSDSNDYYGCNYYGTTDNINNKTVIKKSTIKQEIDAWYEDLSYDIKKYIVKHNFDAGIIGENVGYNTAITQSRNIIINEHVALLGLMDIQNAYVTTPTTIELLDGNNYLIPISGSTNNYWLLNACDKNTYDTWAVLGGNQIGYRRASRLSQENKGINMNFIMKPSFYINYDIEVKGEGTLDSPFIIPR